MTSIGFSFPNFLDHQNPWGAPLYKKSKFLWKEKTLYAVILPFKMIFAQRLSTILLLHFTFCDGWPGPDFTVALGTSTGNRRGLFTFKKEIVFRSITAHS